MLGAEEVSSNDLDHNKCVPRIHRIPDEGMTRDKKDKEQNRSRS